MDKNVRTGIALLCVAAIGGLLVLSGDEGSAPAAIGGILLMVCGIGGLLSVAVGVARPSSD